MTQYTIEQELHPEEKLLWKGKPETGPRLQQTDWFLIPLCLWAGFTILERYDATSAALYKYIPVPFAAPIIYIFIMCLLFYLIIGRFLVDAKIRSNTDYAVTSERAIIASGSSAKKVRSFYLQSIPEISLDAKADGSGTILFDGPLKEYYPHLLGLGYQNFYIRMILNAQANRFPGFIMIPDVRKVRTLLEDAQRSQ